MHQTCKPALMNEDLFHEKFAREQTSSNQGSLKRKGSTFQSIEIDRAVTAGA